MAAKVTFHSRCAWCGQPKIANVHPTHGTSIACVEALKAELRRAEEAGIDAIRAVAVQLAEVTAERDRLAAEVAGADEAVDILVGQYREMRAERDTLAERLAMATEFRADDGVIAVHAPQQWRVHFGRRRGPDDIKALPVVDLADSDCCLFLWAVYPTLPVAIEVMQSWGFAYKTVAFTWMKTYPRTYTPFVGMGHWTRSNAELCLLGTRGKPKRKNRDVQQAILSPIREHSRKPSIHRERIERLVDGPYCELFGRCPRPNWTVWGNDTEKFAAERSLWEEEAA